MDPVIQIPNGTNQVAIHVSDPNMIWLVIGTFILAGATIGSMLWTNFNTRRSNNLLRTDLLARLRPAFTFDLAWVNILQNTNEVEFVCKIISSGTVAITDVIIYYMADSKRITPNMLLTNDKIKETKYQITGTLEPTRWHYFKEKMPPINSDDVWVALWFNYEFLDDVKEEAVAVFYQKISSKGTGFEWYNHKNMQKERAKLNLK